MRASGEKIRVHHTFDEDDNLQRKQKLYFFKGSERVKGSTIHSFKGLESRALILYLKQDKSHKDIHVAYAALTRLKAMREGSILYVLSSNKKFDAYGKTWQGQALNRQFQKIEEIAENQTGISYRNLFGDCLEGATKIELNDPFIKSLHQFLNVSEFAETIRSIQSDEDEIELKLVTSELKPDDRPSPSQQEDAMAKLKAHLKEQFNISLICERKYFHDRSIKTDHGWTITLGRGLDIFKPSERKNPPQTERKMQGFYC